MNSLQQRAQKRYYQIAKGSGLQNVGHLHNVRQLIYLDELSPQQTHMLEHFVNSSSKKIKNTVYMEDSWVELDLKRTVTHLKRRQIGKNK